MRVRLGWLVSALLLLLEQVHRARLVQITATLTHPRFVMLEHAKPPQQPSTAEASPLRRATTTSFLLRLVGRAVVCRPTTVVPISENIGGLMGGLAPPAYVDAADGLEEVESQPRRLRLANAEPEPTDDDSSRAGGSRRRPQHNHKDAPPAATYRQH